MRPWLTFPEVRGGKTRSWPELKPSTVGWSWESPKLEVSRVLSYGSDTMIEGRHTTLEDLGFRLVRGTS